MLPVTTAGRICPWPRPAGRGAGKQGLSHSEAIVRIGSISSLGVLAYALGKLFLTGLGDLLGRARNFLIGVGGAAVFTLLFAAGGTSDVHSRLARKPPDRSRSAGRPHQGLLQVVDYSSMVDHRHSQHQYLVGDAAARKQMGC